MDSLPSLSPTSLGEEARSLRPQSVQAARDICNVYAEGVVGESAARKWFAKFKNGDFHVDDTPSSESPSEFYEERLKALLKEDDHQTSRE
ncbi:hypothetical protein TNCV_3717931 [Trichonephila clavipes]|nr:hypothetical protein TNCV_3717931 [Trichonephila clavipes]